MGVTEDLKVYRSYIGIKGNGFISKYHITNSALATVMQRGLSLFIVNNVLLPTFFHSFNTIGAQYSVIEIVLLA